jgi:hypothetical protein
LLNALRESGPSFSRFVLVIALTFAGAPQVAGADTVLFRGIPYLPLGEATLQLIGTPATGSLFVANVGPSGLDGVSAELPGACRYRVRWSPLPAADDGNLLRLRIHGHLGSATPDTIMGTIVFADTGPALELAVDLRPDEGSLSRVLVSDGHSVVYEGSIADVGLVAHLDRWPDAVHLESACSDLGFGGIRFGWTGPTTVAVVDGPTVASDSLSISIAALAFFATFTRFEMEAAGIPSLTILDADMARVLDTAAEEISSRLTLETGVPNPFNPHTEIHYSLGYPAPVRITVHDVRGQLVKTLRQRAETAGEHSVTWDGTDEAGRDVGSGVYVVRLESCSEVRSRSVSLVR